ncbi:MAG: hypothetical protein GXP26_04735 [Planctomycetes bacterium]|nr:hypothetical protein [Planctomycetota bacterium]
MWNSQQLDQYREQGFLAQPGLLTQDELSSLQTAANDLVSRYEEMVELVGDDEDNGVHYVKENNGAVRSLFAAHQRIEAFRQAIRLPKIAGPLKQIFDNDAYVFHSKVNVKDAFQGTVWLWHQDYGYWQYDGVDDRMASVLIMLDKTTIHGGCLLFVPGSHQWGVLEHESDEATTSYKQWCVTKPALLERIQDDRVYVPIVGEPGDVFFFDCKILHGSGHNMSPASRKSLIFACADVDNQPKVVENPRPDWVVARQFEPFTNDIQLEPTES